MFDGNITDIAVGAYVSGKVFLFKCHPSVQVTPKIEVIPTELSLNLTSFTVQICLRFTGHSSFETGTCSSYFSDTHNYIFMFRFVICNNLKLYYQLLVFNIVLIVIYVLVING